MTTTTDMQGQAAANVMEARVRADGPHRVQLSRKKGWRMPENTVSVARPGRWGNPFVIGETYPVQEGCIGGFDAGKVRLATASDVVAAFESWAADESEPLGDMSPLRGKNLACWCKLGDPCHADVLLDLANRDHAPIVQREVG